MIFSLARGKVSPFSLDSTEVSLNNAQVSQFTVHVALNNGNRFHLIWSILFSGFSHFSGFVS